MSKSVQNLTSPYSMEEGRRVTDFCLPLATVISSFSSDSPSGARCSSPMFRHHSVERRAYRKRRQGERRSYRSESTVLHLLVATLRFRSRARISSTRRAGFDARIFRARADEGFPARSGSEQGEIPLFFARCDEELSFERLAAVTNGEAWREGRICLHQRRNGGTALSADF